MLSQVKWSVRLRVAEEHLEGIPNEPGVYVLYFYGRRRCVGQTKYLQSRLTQHFIEDVGFTEFAWCETATVNDLHVENCMSDAEFNSLWTALHGCLNS